MAEKETPLNLDDISSEPLVANSVLSTDNPVMEEGTPDTGDEDIKPTTPSAEDGGDDEEDSIDGVDSRRGRLYLAYIKKNLPKLSKPYGVRVFNDYFLIQPKFENPND